MYTIPHLETDVNQACQLSCVGCNHLVPLWRKQKGGPWSAEPAQVKKDLFHLAGFLHAERWGALGGEPLLHSKLIDILKIARDSGVADRTEVWTNGLLLQRQTPEFWRSFDILVLSIYPGKHDENSIEWIINQCRDTGVQLDVKDERLNPNFRTLLEPEPTGPEATQRKFEGCFFRHFSRVANYGYFFTCCCAPHMPMLLHGDAFGTDGVKIEGLTEEGLSAYLTRSEPLSVCKMCAGRDTAVAIDWREEKDPEAWKAASAGR